MDSYSFENLEVWKVSRKFVVEVYKIQSSFPSFEKYGLGDQLRRAVISIPSNMAEGNGRTSLREQIHFIEIAYGSLMEVYCQLIISYDLKYIDEEQLEKCKSMISQIGGMLNGLRRQKISKLSPK